MKFRNWVGIIALAVLPYEAVVMALSWVDRSCPYGERMEMPRPFQKAGGHSYVANIPELEKLADDLNGYHSPLRVCENSQVLGQPHAFHHEIRELGLGRYSHWSSSLFFSTSDNSDPNTNGRSYLLVKTADR